MRPPRLTRTKNSRLTGTQDPDNYTDQETFLDHLQRNPRLRPYEFWPLVADSTVIVQQVCAVIVFVCCFSGIIQERISPITVVSWGTALTVFGWVLWDIWVGREEALQDAKNAEAPPSDDASERSSKEPAAPVGLGLAIPNTYSNNNNNERRGRRPVHSRQTSANSTRYNSSTDLRDLTQSSTNTSPTKPTHSHSHTASFASASASFESLPFKPPPSAHTQQRFATAKSAVLIYCALLGLSPILKSLTKSTASDSIWAISFWLMCINIFFFDYGGGVGATFPASLSTNAALMASTVLASRLPSTTHVFSLTLFSIEVFGLFPVFRRYLRHVSWVGHLALSGILVMGASGGVALCLSSAGGLATALLGVVLGCCLTSFAMGLCSWWLIGLQRYKNEIHGPWDAARPIIRRRWD